MLKQERDMGCSSTTFLVLVKQPYSSQALPELQAASTRPHHEHSPLSQDRSAIGFGGRPLHLLDG